MLLPFIATVSWKKGKKMRSKRSTGRHYQFTERADHGRQCLCISTLPCIKMKWKGNNWKTILHTESKWYELSPPPSSTFCFVLFLFFCFPITSEQIGNGPTFIPLCAAFTWHVSCFSPWKYIQKHWVEAGHSEMFRRDFCFLFKEFPWGRVKPFAPDISTWGEQSRL